MALPECCRNVVVTLSIPLALRAYRNLNDGSSRIMLIRSYNRRATFIVLSILNTGVNIGVKLDCLQEFLVFELFLLVVEVSLRLAPRCTLVVAFLFLVF